MTRRGRQRLLVLILAAGLVAAVVWQTRHDASSAVAASLSPLDPARIDHVELTFRGGPKQAFTRRDGQWYADERPTEPIDGGKLDELASMAAVPAFSWRPASDFDPAKLGLAPPLATLRLDDTELEFGEPAAVGEQRYVRVGDRIALVPLQALPRPMSGKRVPLS